MRIARDSVIASVVVVSLAAACLGREIGRVPSTGTFFYRVGQLEFPRDQPEELTDQQCAILALAAHVVRTDGQPWKVRLLRHYYARSDRDLTIPRIQSAMHRLLEDENLDTHQLVIAGNGLDEPWQTADRNLVTAIEVFLELQRRTPGEPVELPDELAAELVAGPGGAAN